MVPSYSREYIVVLSLLCRILASFTTIGDLFTVLSVLQFMAIYSQHHETRQLCM